jgi:hypothetical protein
MYEEPAPETADADEFEDARVSAIWERIAAGRSQVSIDSGATGASLDGARWRRQQLDYLRDLLKTPTGRTLLIELDRSRHKTTITRGSGATNETDDVEVGKSYRNADGSANDGTAVIVRVNPDLTSFAMPGELEEPWMTERPRYGLYHELVHAYHDTRGEAVNTGKRDGIHSYEFQAVGLGPHADEEVSENKIRRELGKEERPSYAGAVWDGHDRK